MTVKGPFPTPYFWAVSIASLLCLIPTLWAQELDFSSATIPVNEILPGGPPKDGIPALTDPEFVSAEEAAFLKEGDRVLGIVHEDIAKAYPIGILNWHEVVNDRIGTKAITVTYCPLCGSGMAFDAHLHGERLLFGVSGRLYNSDVLLYDRKTGSLWSQLRMEAVTGEFSGTALNWIPLLHTTWGDWKKQYPNTQVLSERTGHFRNYSRDPYRGYANEERLIFPVSRLDKRLLSKAWVLGVLIGGQAKAYPFSALERSQNPLRDKVDGQPITVHFSKATRSAWVTDESGEALPSVQAYWFAWSAFYPETGLYAR